jgi:hypothetical protein
MWIPLIKDIAICALLCLVVWLPLGRWFLAKLGDACCGSVILSTALGLAGWGFSILVLGLMGWLHPWTVALVAAALFLSLRLHRYFRRAAVPSRSFSLCWEEKIFYACMGVLSGIYLLLALASAGAPELAFDALNVHLPYARDAAVSNRIQFLPNNWSSIMPALPLMSYITAFLFSGLALAKLLNPVVYFLCGGVVYYFLQKWWGSVRALAGALLFWSCPVALYEATTTLIDLPLALYSAISLLALLEWTRSEEKPYLQLSAVGLGLALGCKYHALFWVPPIAFILLWHSRRVQGRPATEVLKLQIGYWLIVAALFFPWLLRAWYFTGNPVFPAANSFFESPYFTPAMEQAAQAAYENEGIGRSLVSILKLPWAVTFNPAPFRGTLGVVFFVGVAAALIRRQAPQICYALISVALYFYTWALTAQEIRYLLPLVPLLSLLTVSGLAGTGRSAPQRPRSEMARGEWVYRVSWMLGMIVILLGSAIALPNVYPRLVGGWTYWHSYKSPLSLFMGRETAEQYLERDVPSIYVYNYVNEHLDRDHRILLVNDASRFYSRVPTLYSFTLEGERILLEDTEGGVVRRLKESGISHVLLNYNSIEPLPGVEPRRGVYFFLDEGFQGKYLEPLFSKNNVVLYRLASP